ncbi:MAG: DUF2339 domain-containing protein [Pseudomonadales bacterium]|nr:DUF2339 domain-containing protein [Pseudomonadales bacterium]
MLILIGLAFAIIGGSLFGPGGLLFGAVLGSVAAYVYRQQNELKAIAARLQEIESRLPSAPIASAETSAPAATQDTYRPEVSATADETREVYHPPVDASPAPPGRFESTVRELLQVVVRFFTTGNLVVRVGVVVLFFGVAFLLRFAYENAMLPIELRLAGSSVFGVILTALGWRFRARTDTYGVVLQGAGVGLLYLTIFAAARMYDLLPITAAFALLVVLAAASCILAVLQNAQSLAIFATTGGFLAPVLTSTGAGSHVALFSYYALLNAGILAMAWFRYWRWLNWIGFVFTFAIGATWGYQYYQPEYFRSTEPFLLLFFVYYVAVSVLFSRRQSVNLKAVVDGTLVFGTPIIAFALQAALVADMPFGLAYSALAAAVFYVLLALWLRRTSASNAAFAKAPLENAPLAGSLLGQSFLALAVIFATLAIPFAFDNHRFTAASWALEGAGLLWVGLRQRQTLTRCFGVLLQLAAAVAYVAEIGTEHAGTLFLNSAWLGMAILGLAAAFTAYLLSAGKASVHRLEGPLSWFFLLWGGLWWLAGLYMEWDRFEAPASPQFVATNLNTHLFLLAASASFAAVIQLSRWLRWRDAQLAGFFLLPLLVSSLLGLDKDWHSGIPLTEFGWLAWPAGFAVLIWHLRTTVGWPRLLPLWHAALWWFFSAFCAWCTAALAHSAYPDSAWTLAAWGAPPLLLIAGLLRARDLARWPLIDYWDSYLGRGMATMFLALIAWLLLAGVLPADPAPLPYLVIVNPLELTQLGVLLAMAVWVLRVARVRARIDNRVAVSILAVVGFLWLNLTAARAVHFYAGVDYPIDALAGSDAFQTTLSILWTLIALVAMGAGARRRLRTVWIVGAVLLAVVILKLFTVDLSNLGVISRIISFISVGALMLFIGFLAPLPPSRAAEHQEATP